MEKQGDKFLRELKDEAINRGMQLTLIMLQAQPRYNIDWIGLHQWLIDRRN